MTTQVLCLLGYISHIYVDLSCIGFSGTGDTFLRVIF